MTNQQTAKKVATEGEHPRWAGAYGISGLSTAVDEIYFLRAVLADEAAIIEAHLGYKTFPKARRAFAEQQVERMRRIARGEMWPAARENFDQSRALRTADAPTTLTNVAWAEQRGLRPVLSSEDWRDKPHVHAGTDCGGGADCPAR
jgi:hypothetical protein